MKPTRKQLEALLSEARSEICALRINSAQLGRERDSLKQQLSRIAEVRLTATHQSPEVITVAYQVSGVELRQSRDPSVIFDYLHHSMAAALTKALR